MITQCREQEAREQVNQLQRELGKAEGKIETLEVTRQAAQLERKWSWTNKGRIMSNKTKVVKVDATAESWWFRRIGQPPTEKKLEKAMEEWGEKGYRLLSTVPVTNNRGKVTAYMLTFEKAS